MMPAAAGGPSGGLASGVAIPPPPARQSRSIVSRRSPTRCCSPAGGEWLTWRRAFDAQGSARSSRSREQNVAELRPAWSWSLPNGPNEATPLVHDGVMFVHGFGDKVQALDAATGDLLWQYSRRLPQGSRPS